MQELFILWVMQSCSKTEEVITTLTGLILGWFRCGLCGEYFYYEQYCCGGGAVYFVGDAIYLF